MGTTVVISEHEVPPREVVEAAIEEPDRPVTEDDIKTKTKHSYVSITVKEVCKK